MMQLDILMLADQEVRFSNEPMLSHERATIRISWYPLDTKDIGIICKSDLNTNFEYCVDVDFTRYRKQVNYIMWEISYLE